MSPSARQLTETVSWVREHLWKRAAMAVALWVAAAVALVLMAAWLAVGSEGWRPGSNVPAVFDAVIVAWIIAGIVVVLLGSRRWFGEAPLASSMERAAGLRAGIVRGSMELTRSVPTGVSDTLASVAVARTAAGLSGRPAKDLAGDLGRRVALWTRRGMIALAIAVVVLVALGIAGPDRAANAWAGVRSPISTMINPRLAPIVVRPGTVEVMRGTDVRVDIEAQGRLEVELVWQEAGEVSRASRLSVVGGRSSYVFEAVSAATEYRVRTDEGTETETYRIVPIDPLFVSDLVVGVEYPPHTGLAPDEYRGSPPPLRLPVESRLTFEGLASRPLSEVALADSSGSTRLSLDVDGPSFTGAWTPTLDGAFSWIFRDQTGAPAEIAPDPLQILLVPDSIPTVSILSPGQDTVLPLSLRQPLVVDARDDYGLTRFELVAYRITSFGEREEPVVQGLELGGTRGALARPTLDLTTWGLLPGDTVRYFARVVDNNPASQVGVSREFSLRMPAARELQRDAQSTLENVAQSLEQLRDEAARQAEANQNQALEDAARRNQPPTPSSGDRNEQNFEKREELQRAMEEQAALLEQVDSLKAKLESLQQAMEEAGQSDPDLAAQLEQLQDLLEELAGSDAQERMDELSRELERQGAPQNQALQDLARDQDVLRDRIDEALERFKRAAAEQDFRATTTEAQDLARQQQALADAMKEQDRQELRAEQQSDLAEKAEQLESRMQDLAERLSELEEQQAASAVDRAREQASQARQQMEQAQQRARQGDDQQASDQAQQAADQMKQAADRMQGAQGQMAQQSQQNAQDTFQKTADDALSLARRQAELQQRMQNASQDQLSDMRGDQASLQRGLQNIQSGLDKGTQAAGGQQQQSVSDQLERAMQSMQNTVDALEGRRSSSDAARQAEQAVSALNQLAMSAIAAGSQQEAGSMSPGQSGQDLAKQLGQLAQRQGQLVSQTGQLAPMRLSEHALQQQLNELAGRQASVARDIQDAARQPDADAALGDLQALAEQADQLAQQMDRGRLTPDIMHRQQELFHRLLDAGRTLERDDFSNERESKQPGEFERGDVLPLSAAQLGLTQYDLPDGDQMRRLSPAVRQLVLEYFDRLNRVGPATEDGR